MANLRDYKGTIKNTPKGKIDVKGTPKAGPEAKGKGKD